MLYKVIIKMHVTITLHNNESNALYYKISVLRRPVSSFYLGCLRQDVL